MSEKIVIIGAGPGGMAAASVLASHGIPSIILEKGKFPRDKICGDALSGKVTDFFERENPAALEKLRNSSIQLPGWGITFYGPNGKDLRIPFQNNYNPSQNNSPGFISKRLDFDNFLKEELLSHPLIELREEAFVKKYERQGDKWKVILESGEELITGLLLVADGAQSSFARKIAGIKPEPENFCGGVRAYYKGIEGMDRENFIELHFLKDLLPGYFWIFPLPDGHANIGLGMRKDIISKRKVSLTKYLDYLVNDYPPFKDRFKNAIRIDETRGFGLPLGGKKRNLSGDGYMLIGDAGALIDPFTGEGIGNAMISGREAAKVAVKALENKDFSGTFLKEYDLRVYGKLWDELKLSKKLQQLSSYPFLFNFVINRIRGNKKLEELMISMFTDLDVRARMKSPFFYVNLLLNKNS